MAHFQTLTVTNIEKTIKDAVCVTLEAEGEMPFVQGQYLTFKRDFDGTELRRSYSICAGRDDGVLQVGIKKVDGGAFSTWANEDLKVGEKLEAMAPMGNFFVDLDADQSRNYLCFAFGSGITPILSIIKTTLSAEPLSRFTLVYANRSVHSVMFREELEDLKNLHMGRLNIIHMLDADVQDIDLFTGPLTAEKCEALCENWIDISTTDIAFICGPQPAMETVASCLEAAGLSKDCIKFELFGSQSGRLNKPKRSRTDETEGATATTIIIDGTAQHVSQDRSMSVLDTALQNDLDAPYACKAGVCSTCRCKVIEGEAEMVQNHALEDYEVAQGYVLSCQAYPKTEKLVVEYDH